MTRLNTTLRDQIVTAAQEKSGNKARREATAERRKAWAEKVRISALGADAEKLEKLSLKFEKLEQEIPERFRSGYSLFSTRGSLNLNCAGLTVRVSEWEGCKVSPGSHTLLAEDPLVQEFHDICAEEKANTESWETVKTNVKAAVYSVTTVAKLLKIWPEAKELLPAYVEESKVQLPALQVADLNALVGLPSGDEK